MAGTRETSAGTSPPVARLLDLSGRVALVTGAGRGIGATIAARCAEAGARVIVHYRHSAEAAHDLAMRLGNAAGPATALDADLTDATQVRHLFDRAATGPGVPDIVVNNAGSYPTTKLLEVEPIEWNAVVAANLTSVHLVTQEAARRLGAAGRVGAIVNIASIEAHNVAPSHAHYCAAKAAVVMYTRSAARELGPAGIRVNVVSPGLIWQRGLDEAWPDGVARYRAAAPLGRLGRADDVADACLFLASAAARWVTGTELVVDGGVLTNTAY
jgi:NAD(P)-dependent dehydrogenase (short-subunit alcohol dehydrogenase family)